MAWTPFEPFDFLPPTRSLFRVVALFVPCFEGMFMSLPCHGGLWNSLHWYSFHRDACLALAVAVVSSVWLSGE